MAAAKLNHQSSLSSRLTGSSPQNRKPKRDAKWHAMIKRRNFFKKRQDYAKIKQQFSTLKRNECGSGGYSLETSQGVSWVRSCLLGKGTYGSVFLAKRRTIRTRSTAKTYNDDFPDQIAVKSASLELSSTLKQEKRILCDLTASPFVIRCYGDEITSMGGGKKVYNILLEYCSGRSLRHQIKLSGSTGLPESDVRAYTRDIIRGLKYIHCRGYVHCDLKPDNILLAPGTEERSGSFVAKIADFGLAMSIYEYDEDDMKYFGSKLRGTYRYLSPEAVTENRYQYCVDIWALGCVVVEMLSGNPVWPKMDVEGYLYTIGRCDDLPQVPTTASDEAKDFLAKCLVRNFAQRWSAEQLLEHPFLSVG